jgi:hypothetical protein
METREEHRWRVQRAQQINKRLRLATTRLHEAEQERLWAIVAAHDVGLSILQIATATGLSSSRIHQLLQTDDAREMPAWLTHLRDYDRTSDVEAEAAQPFSQSVIQARVTDEVEVVRWCITCLAQLKQRKMNVPLRCL